MTESLERSLNVRAKVEPTAVDLQLVRNIVDHFQEFPNFPMHSITEFNDRLVVRFLECHSIATQKSGSAVIGVNLR